MGVVVLNEEYMSRLAVVEDRLDAVMPLLSRCDIMESNLSNLRKDTKEIRKSLEDSQHERHVQYNTMIEKFSETNTSISNIKTVYQTTVIIFGALASLITIMIAFYAVIPK